MLILSLFKFLLFYSLWILYYSYVFFKYCIKIRSVLILIRKYLTCWLLSHPSTVTRSKLPPSSDPVKSSLSRMVDGSSCFRSVLGHRHYSLLPTVMHVLASQLSWSCLRGGPGFKYEKVGEAAILRPWYKQKAGANPRSSSFPNKTPQPPADALCFPPLS